MSTKIYSDAYGVALTEENLSIPTGSYNAERHSEASSFTEHSSNTLLVPIAHISDVTCDKSSSLASGLKEISNTASPEQKKMMKVKRTNEAIQGGDYMSAALTLGASLAVEIGKGILEEYRTKKQANDTWKKLPKFFAGNNIHVGFASSENIVKISLDKSMTSEFSSITLHYLNEADARNLCDALTLVIAKNKLQELLNAYSSISQSCRRRIPSHVAQEFFSRNTEH